MKKCFILLIATLSTIVCAYSQISVNVDGLFYHISGTTASVAPARQEYYLSWIDRDIYRCRYQKTEYTIPSIIEYNGYNYTVVSIEEGAFADQIINSDGKTSYYNSSLSTIRKITIPNTITHIGAYAFYGCRLEEYFLPNIEKIDEYAFAENRQLKEITAPNLKSVGVCSFAKCTNLTTINMQKTERIGKKAFESCSSLTSLVFPKSLVSLEDDVFQNCNLLRELLYLSQTPPLNWVATSMTYVPDKQSYSSPKTIINDGKVIEMVTYITNDFDYTGQPPTSTWVNNVSGYDATLSFSEINKDVGNHEEWIPVTFTKGDNSFICDVIFRYSIKPITLTLQAKNKNREYGEDNPIFSLSYSGFVSGENENVFTSQPTISTTATKLSDVGEYPITISGGEAQNYTFAYEPGVLTVTKAPLTAKVNDATREYGKDNPSFSVSYTGLKNDETVPKWTETLKIETTATKQSDVGTYAITATGVPTNYDLSSIENGTLTITQAPLTLKANNATRKYFEEEPDFTYTCSGFLNGDNTQVLTKSPTFTTDATKTSDVGKYQITPSGAKAKNYAISYEPGELTITKRTLKSTSYCSRPYGEENPVLSIEYDGFVNDETENVLSVKPVGTTTATKTSKVGEYPITLRGGEATNYDFVYNQGVLTVTKAALSAKVSDATKVYGENNPTFTIEYYGLKNGETVPTWTTAPTFKTDATKASGVGQYAISAIDGVSVNYDLAIDDGTLTITPAPLTIQAKDVTRQYYSENPTFSYGCSGFVNGDDKSVLTLEPTLSSSASLTSNVGEYNIEVNGASSTNYSISYVNGTLTVTPRTLMASVGNYDRIYNEENPEFEVKYDGFVGNDDENVLISKAIASTIATKTSDVGTYPINVTDGSADNYKFSYIYGTLTINKAEQTISWEQDLSNLKVGEQVELHAVASSGLPITYTMESNSYAEIYSAGNNKKYLDCKAEGQFVIRAVQEGNKNYYSSTRINKTVIIGNGESAVKSVVNSSVKIQVMDYGIRVSDANSDDVIRVYSIDGVLQKTVKAEGLITDIPLSKDKVYIVKVGGKTVKLSL